MFYWFSKAIIVLLLKILTRWEVEGREKVPPKGPLLLVFNHLGHLDPLLLMASLPWRFTGIALADLQKVPVTGQLLRLGRVIWVHRGRYDRGALEAALKVLREGGVLGIAAEGRMSLTGALERGKTGPVFLAEKAGVPLFPVAITGTEKAPQQLKRLKRPHLRVIIGEPFRLPENPPGSSHKERLQAQADFIMERLAELLPPEYRGVYGEKKAEG